jgi:CopG antitoxin of type II toxin-antitoxin system
VTVNPRLRRRIDERAAQKKAITLRLETQQIERAKLVAQRKSIPYQTLMRMWIAEGLAKEGVKTAEVLMSVGDVPGQGSRLRGRRHPMPPKFEGLGSYSAPILLQ